MIRNINKILSLCLIAYLGLWSYQHISNWELTLGEFSQLLGIIVGAGCIVYQVHSEHQSAKKLQIDQFKNQVCIDLYERIRPVISEATEKAASFTIRSAGIPDLIILKWNSQNNIKSAPGITLPSPEHLLKVAKEVRDSVGDLSFFLRRYRVAVLPFETFARVLTMQIEKTDVAFELFNKEYENWAPADVKMFDVANPFANQALTRNPTGEEFQRLCDLYQTLELEISHLSNFIYDIDIEAQNILLGDVFGGKVSIRQPREKKYLVLNSSPSALENFEKLYEEWERKNYPHRYKELVSRN
jgi:hypothetical protein